MKSLSIAIVVGLCTAGICVWGIVFFSGCGARSPNVSESSPADVHNGVVCAKMQIDCANDAATLEDSAKCRARARAICKDGGTP